MYCRDCFDKFHAEENNQHEVKLLERIKVENVRDFLAMIGKEKYNIINWDEEDQYGEGNKRKTIKKNNFVS